MGSVKKKNWVGWTLWLFLSLGVLGVVLHWFSFTDFSHRWAAKRVQSKIYQIESLLHQSQLSYEGSKLPETVSLYVFKGDSLVYWNSNQLEPRRLRNRITVGTDTLVQIHSNVYLLTSFDKNARTVFLFSSLGQHFSLVSDTGASSNDVFPVYSSTGKQWGLMRLRDTSLLVFTRPFWCYGGLSLMLICAFLLVFRYFSKKQWVLFENKGHSNTLLWVLLFAATVVFFVWIFHLLFQYGFRHGFFIPSDISVDLTFFLYVVAFLCLILVLLGIKALLRRPSSFMVIQLVLWAVLLTYLYNKEYIRYENRNIQELAMDLIDERDPAFEASYQQFLNVAQHDTTFFSTVLSDDIMEEVAEDYIRNLLFDSVMNQYMVKLTLCQPGVELEVQPLGLVSDCMGYFQDKVDKNHGIDLGEGLCFLDYNTLDPSYLGMINVLANDTVSDRNLFLEFSKPVAPQGFGLSKLLRGSTSMVPVNASVACYQDSVLVYKYGSYSYPNYLSDYPHQINGFSYGRLLKHYACQTDGSKVVDISVNRRGWMEVTTPFAFFFFFLLILFFLMYLVGGADRKQPLSGTLSSKFHMMVLGALGISFLVLGPVSVFYMRSIYNQKANDFHFERTRSLQQDLASELDVSFLQRQGLHYELERILRHYSATFFTDINLYGLDGKLLATTCPDLQEQHLQAALMNAEAFHNMQGERSLYFIHEEHLGNATYRSAYIAMQNENGKTVAYLNTPYFSSKSGLRVEIVNFILTYINIMLLIMLLFLPLVLLLTRRITNPLVQLQEKMQQIDINKPNELLEWKSKDEIGALVGQYNQLVVELEKSAAELRRTTTESAWRGVARQVAHEIKNSLTPMRLSVQLLQRSMETGAADLDERVKRTSATLIEQIDALSNIASSFSSYAKLPESHPQPLDLAELVGNVVNLYDNAENITFSYEFDPSQKHVFNGDKTHLNSAVGNLIKNATQAIGSKPDGQIKVCLQTTETAYRISVKDNGKGIKEEDKKMIFLPNFTTKSGGSGVGLSLTYNIIQSAGGTITFESQEGVGTEFIISLPREI